MPLHICLLNHEVTYCRISRKIYFFLYIWGAHQQNQHSHSNRKRTALTSRKIKNALKLITED